MYTRKYMLFNIISNYQYIIYKSDYRLLTYSHRHVVFCLICLCMLYTRKIYIMIYKHMKL